MGGGGRWEEVGGSRADDVLGMDLSVDEADVDGLK